MFSQSQCALRGHMISFRHVQLNLQVQRAMEVVHFTAIEEPCPSPGHSKCVAFRTQLASE